MLCDDYCILIVSPFHFIRQEQGDDTSIKIADFGFAKKVPRPNCLRTLCGTAQYVAPEVLELKDTGYDTRADMWSVGVVVYSKWMSVTRDRLWNWL